MTNFLKDLRGKVLWRTTERMRLLISLQYLGQAKICQTNITIFSHQNIFWLKIPIYDLLFMKMTDGKCNSQRIKLCSLLRELPCLSKMHEELTTSHKLHNEEDLLICLKNVFHTHEERMIGFL